MLGLGTRLVKLRNGELLIAGVTRIQNDYLLERPMSVIVVPQTNKKGEVLNTAVIFNSWIDFSIDTHFTIPSDAVLTLATPDLTMTADYTTAIENEEINRMQNEFEDLFESLDMSRESGKKDAAGGGNPADSGYNDPNQLPLEDDLDEGESDDSEEDIQ